MEQAHFDLQVLRTQEVTALNFGSLITGVQAVICGEYHPLDRPKTIIAQQAAELSTAGFTLLALEGVPFGIEYDGTESVDQFCRRHFGAKDNLGSHIAMVQAAVNNGIRVVGIDIQPGEEQFLFDKLARLQDRIVEAKAELEQFMTLMPYLLKGVDTDKDMPTLRAAGITFSVEKIIEIASDPAASVGEIQKILAETFELHNAHTAFIVDYRDQIMAGNFIKVLDTHQGKGILHIGLHHCRFASTSSAQRVLASGVKTRVLHLVNARSEFDMAIAQHFNQRGAGSSDVMISIDNSNVVINLPE